VAKAQPITRSAVSPDLVTGQTAVRVAQEVAARHNA